VCPGVDRQEIRVSGHRWPANQAIRTSGHGVLADPGLLCGPRGILSADTRDELVRAEG
jgi:hypothetical protein